MHAEDEIVKKHENEKEADQPIICCTQRWILSYIGFFGFITVLALRVNLSVAIVCMVRTPNISSYGNATHFMNISNDVNGHVREVDTCGTVVESSINERGELDWDVNTRSALLSSFFYGYILLGIPGGWLSDRYGGKFVIGSSMLIGSILTLLTPICARTHVYLVYAIRVSVGLVQAVVFPAMHSMWAEWAPPLERSKLTGLCYSGEIIGNVVTFSTSGFLCAYGFDNGWGSIFYITGICGCIWTAAWFYLTANKPSKHPRITEEEKKYIIGSFYNRSEIKTMNVPWLSIAKSPCVWALVCAHVCYNWLYYTLILLLPTFMKEVLKFDIKQNGVLSALPFMGHFICAIVAGYVADWIRIKNILSTTNTRKLMQTIAFIGAGMCLVATGYCTCETRITAVVLLCIGSTISGLVFGGYLVNHMDFAPKYAGMLFGITNCFATITGIASPILAGYLTPNNTAEEWRNVFFVCAGFVGFGSIIFGTFGSGEIQDWAKDHAMNMEIKYDSEDHKSEAEQDSNPPEKGILNTYVYAINGTKHVVEQNRKAKQQHGAVLGEINEGMSHDIPDCE